jgi:hypothetical protein
MKLKRNRVAVVEPLEEKAPLSALGAAAMPGAAAIVAHQNNGLTVQLTTDQPVYHQGQPILMTLTAKNRTSHTMKLALGPSNDGFFATQNGAEVWVSNPGPQPLFLQLKTLRPGKLVTLVAVWNGVSNIGTPTNVTGTVVVLSQIAGAPPVTIQIQPA